MNRTERQHFVPAFYLSQWAVPEERTGKLRVFDRTSGKSWQTTPDGVAFVRNFYTVDIREAPNAVEDAIAKLEAIGADAIRSVVADTALPDNTAMRPLLASPRSRLLGRFVSARTSSASTATRTCWC